MFGNVKKGFKKAKEFASNSKASLVVGASTVGATVASAAPIAAPDMADALGSVTAVFTATLAVSVLIFGFKKIRSVL